MQEGRQPLHLCVFGVLHSMCHLLHKPLSEIRMLGFEVAGSVCKHPVEELCCLNP